MFKQALLLDQNSAAAQVTIYLSWFVCWAVTSKISRDSSSRMDSHQDNCSHYRRPTNNVGLR